MSKIWKRLWEKSSENQRNLRQGVLCVYLQDLFEKCVSYLLTLASSKLLKQVYFVSENDTVCESEYCQNGGKCVQKQAEASNSTSFECQCSNGYFGESCEHSKYLIYLKKICPLNSTIPFQTIFNAPFAPGDLATKRGSMLAKPVWKRWMLSSRRFWLFVQPKATTQWLIVFEHKSKRL